MGLEERRLLSDMTAPVTAASVTGASAVAGTAVPTYQAASGTTVNVSLSAADPDNAPGTLTTEFSTDNGFTFAKGNTIALTADGTYNVKFFSIDPAGNAEALKSLVVEIGNGTVGQPAPALTVSADPNTLWPPNHKDVTVTVSGTFTPASPGAAGTPTITYNVDDEYSPGGPIASGTAAVTAQGNGAYAYTFQVPLQASRRGQDKDGRTYTINVSAKDSAGGPLVSNFTTVVVPHDQGHGGGGGGGGNGGGGQDQTDRDFIDGVFLCLLGRVADQGGEDYFARQMQNGMTPAQVVSALEHTPEFEQGVVTQLYQTVLGRAPDPSGLATFTGWLQAGATPRMVEQALLTSPEFNADHPDNAGFITAAYQAALGRAPDAAGQAYFTGLLNAGVSRDVVVSDLLYSDEMDQDIVARTYAVVLNRQPDASGNQFFLSGLRHGRLSRNDIYLDLLTSAEFYNDATGGQGDHGDD